MIFRSLLAAIAITSVAPAAMATTFTYTLSGLDAAAVGATFTGSFDYDDATGDYSNVDIMLAGTGPLATPTGDLFAGAYDTADDLLSGGNSFVVFSRTTAGPGDAAIGFILDGTIDGLMGGLGVVNEISVGVRNTATLADGYTIAAAANPPAATIAGPAVPVPATALLLVPGLVALRLAAK